MSRVLVVGAAGRMGAALREALTADPDLRLAAAIDRSDHPDLGKEIAPGISLSADLASAVDRCDVAVDFSIPQSTVALVAAAEPKALPLVIATTGLGEADRGRVESAAKRCAIVSAPNFSIGVNVLMDLVEQAARQLSQYDVDVLELHHGQKIDAPSGTALRLGEIVAQARGQAFADVARYERRGNTGVRVPGSIGMQTLRLGDAPGEHTVYFAGPGERLELTTRSLSRANFATGACMAARWVIGKSPGLYSMRDVLSATR